MHLAVRFLAILTIAALLAPEARWAFLRAPVEACACAPHACACAGHHHTKGRAPLCSMARGGQCGLTAPDSNLNAGDSTLIYTPVEYHWTKPPAAWSFGHRSSDLSLLPSHVRIPDQPPRAIL